MEVFPSLGWPLQHFWLSIFPRDGFGKSPAEIESGEIEMMDLKNLVSDEQKLRQRIAKLQSDLVREVAKKKAAARKLDSHRKIILGGVLIAAIRVGGIQEMSVRSLIAKFAKDTDKTAFDDFVFEVPVRAVSDVGSAQETDRE